MSATPRAGRSPVIVAVTVIVVLLLAYSVFDFVLQKGDSLTTDYLMARAAFAEKRVVEVNAWAGLLRELPAAVTALADLIWVLGVVFLMVAAGAGMYRVLDALAYRIRGSGHEGTVAKGRSIPPGGGSATGGVAPDRPPAGGFDPSQPSTSVVIQAGVPGRRIHTGRPSLDPRGGVYIPYTEGS